MGVVLVVAWIVLWGGANEEATLALSLAATLSAVALVTGRALCGRRTTVGLGARALGALGAYGALQLVPLPPSVLRLLSPRAADLYLDAHLPLGLYPAWRPLSLDPQATGVEVARLVGLGALFLVLEHRARATGRARRQALMVPALVLAGLAFVALLLRVLGQTSLAGLWETAGGATPFVTPFRNDNHLAGALVVAALVLLGFAASTPEDEPWRRRAFTFGALVASVVVASGTSLGGLVALGAGLVVFVLKGRGQRAWAPVLLVALAGVVLVAIAPDEGAWQDAARQSQSGKLVPMRLAWHVARDFPLTGAGLGAFRTLHDRYLESASQVTYTHVENEPLQLLAEAGGLATLCVLVVLGVCLVQAGRRSDEPLEAGAWAGAVALLLQNLVDFSLHFAGAALLVLLLANGGAPTRRKMRSAAATAAEPVGAWTAGWWFAGWWSAGWWFAGWWFARRRRIAHVAFGVGAVAACVVALLFARPSLDVAEAGLERLANDPSTSPEALKRVALEHLRRHPADYVAAQAVVAHALRTNAPFDARWLQALLSLAPRHGGAHLLAGEALARRGAKAQALLEWRQAADFGVVSMGRVVAWYPDWASVEQASPSSPSAVVASAKVLVEEGQTEWALKLFRAKRAGEWRDYDSVFVDLLLREGEYEEALSIAEALRGYAPEWNFAWRTEALALASLGRHDEAWALVDEGLGRLPGDFMLATLRAGFDRAQGRFEEALGVLATAWAPTPETRARISWERSLVYEAMGKGPLALREMQTAVFLNPLSDPARVRWARLALEAGNPDEARRALGPAAETPEVAALRAAIDATTRKTPSARELEPALR